VKAVSNISRLSVLYEDNHLLAVNKPAGLATIGVRDDELSLAKLAKDYLKQKYHKPGNVYLGVMSRLDMAVSGVVLLARTSKAAARLSEQFRTRAVEKTYLAVVAGILDPPTATFENWLLKNESRRLMEVVPAGTPDAQDARLTVKRLAVEKNNSLVEVELETGRKHQIRVQLAERGYSIIGDRKYGNRVPFASGIALHAARLVVEHPTRDERLTIMCPPPASWKSFGFPAVSSNLLR
jgi:23S rRNA pseudouridine1911/1915/1917 synthase